MNTAPMAAILAAPLIVMESLSAGRVAQNRSLKTVDNDFH
jgi:hypothetical protein